MNRRDFLSVGAGAAALAAMPRWMNAQSPQDPNVAAAATPIKTTKLADNVYLLQGMGGNMALQTGSEGNVLIDSSYAGAAPRILEAIGAVSKNSPDALINTHWHTDHTSGNAAMHAAGFTIFAHRMTRERLSHAQFMKLFHRDVPTAPKEAWPVVVFDSELSAWHNGDQLDLVHFAPAHTDTDIYIHFNKADVLHMGDTFFNGAYPFIDEGTGGNIGGMIEAAELGLKIAGPDTKVIPGHGPLGDRKQLQAYRDVIVGARDKVAALKAKGLSEADVVAQKPTAETDEAWGKGFMNPATFLGIVYRTVG